jgi:hypothetical protein
VETTDANGAYRFENLVAGTYDVIEVQPTGLRDGRDTVTGGQGSVSGNDRFTITLAPGDDAAGLIFGERPQQPSKRELLASRFANLA